MKTILITTDFSEASIQAARYVASLSQFLETQLIILYHSYDIPPVGTEIPLAESTDTTLSHEQSVKALEALSSQIKPLVNAHTEINIIADERPLILGASRLTEQYHVDLIVVGMTGKSGLEKALMGSNTIHLAQTSTVNLLIVPAEASFGPIKKAVFACDFEKVDKTVPIETLYQFTKQLNLELLILHVAKPNTRFNPDMIPEQFKLHELLDELGPQYHYTTHQDIAEGIMEFAEAAHAGLVMTAPKAYGFLESLLHRSVTKRLAYHTRLPLLLLK